MVNEIIRCTKVSVNLIEKIFDFLENNVDNILSKKKYKTNWKETFYSKNPRCKFYKKQKYFC